MEIVKQRDGAQLTVRLRGRFDSNTSDSVTCALEGELDDGLEELVFDMAGVDFISSKGIRVLIATGKQLKAKGADLAVCGANAAVLEVLRMAGLDKRLTIRP